MNWEEGIGGIEAQGLTIRILTALSSYLNTEILARMALHRRKIPAATYRHLELCVGAGSELREDPHCYDGVEKICMAILRRQTNRSCISKKEYGEALGLGNRMQRLRIEKGEAHLELDKIERVCSGFSDPGTRRFWENQLLGLYPDVSSAGRKNVCEADALRWLGKILMELGQYEAAVNGLDALDARRMEDLFGVSAQEPCTKGLGEEPQGLYSVINLLAGRKGMAIPRLAEEEMGVQVNTWYAWRKSWLRAEECGFLEGVPKNRLKRAQIMMLSVVFELSYPESVYFMALSGYRYVRGEPDDEVLRSLWKVPGAREADEIRKYLRDGMYNGKW